MFNFADVDPKLSFCCVSAFLTNHLLVFQATACLPSLVDKENHQPLALRLKDSRREPEKVVKDPGKVQLSQREPKAPSILRRCIAN